MLIHSSEANRALLTFGTYSDGPQLRLWRRSSKSWPQENVLAFKDQQFVPDADVLQPVAFVNHQEAKIAVVTKDGLSLLNTKKGKLEQQIPIPSVEVVAHVSVSLRMRNGLSQEMLTETCMRSC